ncbi:MAG: exodeoxyribonuclease VII small subunit [Verrucomicrobia bacterium]|nr:exodeoxyribonuclease VII small subunit [Verrucomicrobiota bacterium]
MATTRKKSGETQPAPPAGDQAAEGLKFEQALERLEKIVAEMESAELPLDEVVGRFEEGTRLVRFCAQKLEEAEKKIEILAKKKDGTVITGAFEPELEAESARTGAAKEKDGKLF